MKNTDNTTSASKEAEVKKAEVESVADKAVTETAEEDTDKAVTETAEEDTDKAVTETAEEITEEVPVFTLDGEEYTFTEDCPAKLRIDNKVYSLKQLCNHEDILTSLVVGESGFVKKL